MKKLNQTILVSCTLLLAAQLTAPAQTLLHRWSFFNAPAGGSTVADSVGGVVATLQGDAVLTGTNVYLNSTNGTYVGLGGNLLTGLQAVTLEGWVDSAAAPDNVHLFEFSDGAGTGNAYLRYVIHDSGNARNFFELADVSGQPNQALSSPTGFGGVPLHVVCVYDPVHGFQAIYTNGVLEASRAFPADQTTLSSVATNEASLGQSPWFSYGDPYMAGTISEFRIWNGVLNPLEVAASDAAGPTTVSTNAGTLTSLQLQVAYQMDEGGQQQAVVMAAATAIPKAVNIASIASYTSSNPSILTVNNLGVIQAVNSGSATISASYGGLTNSQTITVVPPVAVLTNRWSFNGSVGSTTVTDSISGAVGTLLGDASLNGSGQVVLDGVTGTYVSLPPAVFGSLTNVTFEGWFSYTVPNDNVHLFSIDNGDGTGSGGSYLRYNIYDTGHGNNGINYMESIIGYSGPKIYGNMVLPTNFEINVTVSYAPENNSAAIYVNGVRMTNYSGALPALSSIPQTEFTLGHSPWSADGDPDLTGSIDEFRVYNGTKTPQQVALDYQAGPNSIATNNPGALQSIVLESDSTMQNQASQDYTVLANYANLTNFNLTAISAPGLTVTSDNTNIVVVKNALLTAVGDGTAIITAVYQGLSNSVAVTVGTPPLPPLLYRWSFNEPLGSSYVTDSVAGAVGTLNGDAAVNGSGQVNLDGTFNTYVALPGGLLNGLSNVTIVAWANVASGNSNDASLFEFSDEQGLGASYLGFVPNQNSGSQNLFQINTSAGSSGVTGAGGLQGQSVQVACVYDPVAQIQAVYTNGVLCVSKQGVTIPLSSVSPTGGSLGESPFWAMAYPYLTGSIDEFRIYGGRLLPADIAAANIIGPNQLLVTNASLSITKSGADVTLSWPVAASGFSLQSSPTLGPGATWTSMGATPTVVGVTNQVTVTPSTTMFYRLQR